MKTIILVILSLIIAVGALAHPASEVTATYDTETKILKVEYQHEVDKPDKHFIYEVVVKINKKELIKQKLNLQDNEEMGSLIYKINQAKVGDSVEVITKCNKSGKETYKFKIAESKE